MIRFLLLILAILSALNTAYADNPKSSNCLSKGYICFSNDDFVDSVAILKNWGLTVYFLKEKMSQEQKMYYAQKNTAISVSKVSGRFEIYFESQNSKNIKKYKLGVNVNRDWKRENQVTGIYLDINSEDFKGNPGFDAKGIIQSGNIITISGKGSGTSEDHPIDVKWDFNTEVVVIN